jgi:beta-mannanase
VYSASSGGYDDEAWYPGNDFVDIVAVDGYGGKWHKYFTGLNKLSNN